MYKTFGETIASLRRAHGMRQQTLADALAEAGVPVSNQAVSKWENDATLPNAQQFLTLCRVLDVDDIAGTFSGGDAGGLLAGLNAEGRRRALEYIALLRESKRFAAAPEPAVLRSLPNDLPYKGSVRRVLMQAATVDAAPIVWCKKCKFWAPGKSRRGFFEDCVLKQGCMPADGFCRYGVRKE